jgi:cyclophilin family peptidyl-prolyl cis-trans isomerase
MRWMAAAVLGLVACACSSSGSSSGAGGAAGGGGVSATGGTGATGASGGAGGSGGTTLDGSSDAPSDGSGTHPQVELDTSMGKMVFELDDVNMPITTANFLAYVDAGFYSGTIFHRVIPDFMIQGGGFTSGLVQKSTNPPIVLETSPLDTHVYGAISMARTTDPNSATSQFFVVNAKGGVTGPPPNGLDGDYAAFGHMVSGDAILDAISVVPTQSTNGFNDVPVTDVVINSATRL